MFDPKSRYGNLGNNALQKRDGNIILYKKRRFLPQGEEMPVLQQINVMAGDRIDLVASRTLSDPEQFWRVCDANNAIYPLDLTWEPGRMLLIPVPGR